MWNTRRAAPHRFQTVTLAWFEGRCRAPSPDSATVCNHHSFSPTSMPTRNASPLLLKRPPTRPTTPDRTRRPAPWRPWPVLAMACTASNKVVLWRCARWHGCECRIRRGRCKEGQAIEASSATHWGASALPLKEGAGPSRRTFPKLNTRVRFPSSAHRHRLQITAGRDYQTRTQSTSMSAG
jgi:hypothetical protein